MLERSSRAVSPYVRNSLFFSFFLSQGSGRVPNARAIVESIVEARPVRLHLRLRGISHLLFCFFCFPPTHPFLPYVAPHFSHISHFNQAVLSLGRALSSGTARQGDWGCENCGALVFANKEECYKCGAPRPHSAGEPLTHSHYTALTVKNAACDALRERYRRERPDVDTSNADLPLQLHVHRGTARLSRILSGSSSLHKRGYRADSGKDKKAHTLHTSSSHTPSSHTPSSLSLTHTSHTRLPLPMCQHLKFLPIRHRQHLPPLPSSFSPYSGTHGGSQRESWCGLTLKERV